MSTSLFGLVVSGYNPKTKAVISLFSTFNLGNISWWYRSETKKTLRFFCCEAFREHVE